MVFWAKGRELRLGPICLERLGEGGMGQVYKLWCDYYQSARDGAVLRRINSLRTLNNRPAAEVLAATKS